MWPKIDVTHFLKLKILLVICFLSGCAAIYVPPKQNEPAATVKGSYESHGLVNWIRTSITGIDELSAGMKWTETSKMRLFPGKHNLLLKVEFKRNLFGGPYESITDVTADFQQYKAYVVHAKVKGSKVLVWVEDSDGKRVSSIETSSYRTIPR